MMSFSFIEKIIMLSHKMSKIFSLVSLRWLSLCPLVEFTFLECIVTLFEDSCFDIDSSHHIFMRSRENYKAYE